MSNTTEQEYLSILEDIRGVDIEIKKNQRRSRRLRSKMENIRAQLIVDIGSLKDEKGKLVFSNERMRGAELTLRSNNNSEYVDYREELWTLEEKLDDLVTEYNKLIDIKYMLMIKLGLPFDEGAEKYPEFH